MVSPHLNQRRYVVGAGEEFHLFQVIVYPLPWQKSSFKLPFGKNIFQDSPSPPSKSKIMHCCPFGISDSLTQSGVMESMNHLWSLWLSVFLMDVRGPCRCEGIVLTKKAVETVHNLGELAFKLGTLNITTCVSFLYALQCARFVSEKTCQCVPWQEQTWTSKWPKHDQKTCFREYNFEVANQPLLFWGSLWQKMQKNIPPPSHPKRKGFDGERTAQNRVWISLPLHIGISEWPCWQA